MASDWPLLTGGRYLEVALNTGLTVHDMQLQGAPLYGITVNEIKLNQVYLSQNTLCTNCTYLVQSLILTNQFMRFFSNFVREGI
jgi:hypothetical protein